MVTNRCIENPNVSDQWRERNKDNVYEWLTRVSNPCWRFDNLWEIKFGRDISQCFVVRSVFQHVTVHISKNKNRFVQYESFDVIRLEKVFKASWRTIRRSIWHTYIKIDFYNSFIAGPLKVARYRTSHFFRTSGSSHKPSRDFSMLAWPFAMLYCFAVYFCITRVTCSRQLGFFAWREQIADANKNFIFLNIKQYIS